MILYLGSSFFSFIYVIAARGYPEPSVAPLLAPLLVFGGKQGSLEARRRGIIDYGGPLAEAGGEANWKASRF